jgi:hypothetical protein
VIGKKYNRVVLHLLTVVTSGSLLFLLFRKPPIKDWLLVYLFNAVTNGIIDNFITSYKIVKYPVRYFPKVFKTHILFDFLIYPTFTILYNQVTEKDKPMAILYKLFLFTVPASIIEYLAVKKTNLVEWDKGWKWYHTIVSVTFKSLVTRGVIGLIRQIAKKQQNRF